jgi:hypothetical protein
MIGFAVAQAAARIGSRMRCSTPRAAEADLRPRRRAPLRHPGYYRAHPVGGVMSR